MSGGISDCYECCLVVDCKIDHCLDIVDITHCRSHSVDWYKGKTSWLNRALLLECIGEVGRSVTAEYSDLGEVEECRVINNFREGQSKYTRCAVKLESDQFRSCCVCCEA